MNPRPLLSKLASFVEMAEEVLKKIDEQLNCSICLDTYTDPKLLQCFHVYCQQCLVPLVNQDQQGQLGLTCPNCRQVTPIPDKGVAGLQPAFHINRLLDIKESFQKDENPAAAPEEATPTSVNLVKKVGHCSVHEGKELELYCETCEELICLRCVIKGGRHQHHHYEELDQAFEKYKAEIITSLDPMEKQVATVKKVLALLDARCGEISDQRAATADNIHVTFSRLREVLNVRETELIGQLDQVTQAKLKGLSSQRDQIETTLAQLNSCLHFVRESLKTGNERDVLMMKTNTVRRVKELTTPFQPDIFKPNAEADITFLASADITTYCESYGQIRSPGLPDPSRFKVQTKVAKVGEKCTTFLEAFNFQGELCKEPIESLESEIISEITGTRVSCDVERNGQSQYKISYQPTIKGRHQLYIKVHGQHIRGSPFRVVAKSPVEMLGTLIKTIDIRSVVGGIAINQSGEVVTCSGSHIVVSSPGGKEIQSIDTHGLVSIPCGLAVDGEGNILVIDKKTWTIQKFTSEGELVDSVSTFTSGIAFNTSNNKVYLTDVINSCVRVLNSDLTFSSTFGKKGYGPDRFNRPQGIACDKYGTVYVADMNNYRVQVLTKEGRLIRSIRMNFRTDSRYISPVAVAVDSDMHVYVIDNFCRVSVFTSWGGYNIVEPFTYEGMSDHGIAVDSSGVVYVVSNNGFHTF